ncbi:hypothetical protein Pan258_12350 [Symmachiella dynata]|uniref:hypothetical protein n=1 Tax=Symmachiella dynata TaxID=2527995 RepID=UPI00118C8943|nr:hypothetical protein [Symmachiella dynata]QDT47204.1 hypothetical protein Pan258_12350 [Symmachiella dynata]
MTISVPCSCGKSYKVADKLAGKKFKCKACDKVLAIPRPAARKKAKTAKTDEDSDFLDMDLDSEFSRMAAVERPRSNDDDDEWDVTQQRDYRFANGDPNSAEPLQRSYQQGMGVEQTAAIVLGVLAICIGIGLIGSGIYLRVNHGWRIRGFIGLGITSLVSGVGFLVKGL